MAVIAAMNKIKHHQKGAATLFIALVILFLMTMVIVFTAKSHLVNMKVTSNNTRAQQALEAADAGLQYVYENYKGVSLFCEKTVTSGTACSTVAGTIVNAVGLVAAFQVTVDNGAVTSIGYSDDRLAQRTITERVKNLSPLPNLPKNPFTARQSALFAGSGNVYNPEGASTIWAGGQLDLSNTQTYVADPSQDGYPTCLEFSVLCTTVQTTREGNVGLDVVENDSTLLNRDPDDFFKNFFGFDKDTKKAMSDRILTPAQYDPEDNSFYRGEVIWIDGGGPGHDVDLSGMVGCSSNNRTGTITGYTHTTCNDATLSPTLIIVDGDLYLNGNPEFYGLVYVIGELTGPGGAGGGNPFFEGAIIVETSSAASGNLTLIYNSDMLEAIADSGDWAGVSGTWKDFN